MIAALTGRAQEWWSGRSARERALLAAAGVLAAALLLWLGAVAPALTARTRAERAYESALALYQEMTAGARDAARLRLAAPGAATPDGMAAGGEPLRAAASALARDMGLAIARIQPGESGSLAFVFDAADPADLFRWIDALQVRFGASPSAVTVSRNADARTVQASVLVVEAR